jgi:hypothetical protein
MKYLALLLLLSLACALSACASYNIKDAQGNTLSGSTPNGAVSISQGPGCVPTSPSDVTVVPANPIIATAAMPAQICDSTGQHCRAALMSATVAAPVCDTTVVNVHGTDPLSWLKWLAAIGGGAFILAS